MAKRRKLKEAEDVETDPGARERFKHAVDAAVKSGPKHRKATGKIVPPKPHKPAKLDPEKDKEQK